MWKLQALTRLRILSKIAESVFRDTTFLPQVMKYGTKISGAVEGVFHQSHSYCTLLKLGNTTWMEGKIIDAIFIDFRKAFDSVCPEILPVIKCSPVE